MNTNLQPETLSEAIRLGCEIKPRQVFKYMFEGKDGACALGAAAAACLSRPLGTNRDHCFSMEDSLLFRACLPVLIQFSSCPLGCETGSRCGYLEDTVIHLNDDHRWTREKIADWIEENFEQPVKQPVHAEELVCSNV